MTVGPDDDLAAAEFALGTLDPGERAALAARSARESDLAEVIGGWERLLAPLSEAVPDVEPPPDVFPAIAARIRRGAAGTAPAADLSLLRRRVAAWRALAIAASVVAALLAVGFGWREATRVATPRQYVAILQKDPASPAFELTVDLDRQEFSIRPVAAEAPAGKAYELWMIDARLGAPKSLGVIGGGRRGATLGTYDSAIVQGATFAVTVEPPGGSPTGQPSGPPVFVGKLVPVGP